MKVNVASCVSESRLGALIERLATFGARSDGGVNRQALTVADIDARAFLAEHAASIGCSSAYDAAGNMFFRRAGAESSAPVATGSHVDTQPAGGKLDGAYGICAGLEAIAALNDARILTRRPVEVIVWANEEGCRFAPGSLGSMAYVAPGRLAELVAAKDASNGTYAEGIVAMRESLQKVPERALGGEIHAFIEAHIEQGPVLEDMGRPIGVVTAIQGVRWFRVTSNGEAGHAGTVPVEFRRDPLRALTPLLERLYEHAERTSGLRLTVGKIDVQPSSINTIPANAVATIDMRHADNRELDRCEALVRDYCRRPRHGCTLDMVSLMSMPTTVFDPSVQNVLRASTKTLGLEAADIVSGAFHDALHLASHCPAGMLFVPSHKGISHNPDEHTDNALLADGARVLVLALLQLAGFHSQS